jgi:hypothetical protein
MNEIREIMNRRVSGVPRHEENVKGRVGELEADENRLGRDASEAPTEPQLLHPIPERSSANTGAFAVA